MFVCMYSGIADSLVLPREKCYKHYFCKTLDFGWWTCCCPLWFIDDPSQGTTVEEITINCITKLEQVNNVFTEGKNKWSSDCSTCESLPSTQVILWQRPSIGRSRAGRWSGGVHGSAGNGGGRWRHGGLCEKLIWQELHVLMSFWLENKYLMCFYILTSKHAAVCH